MTPDQSSEQPQRSGRYRAMVRAGDSTTAYVRTGHGKPVLLLRLADHRDVFWAGVLDHLSTCCRVILPEQPAPTERIEEWFGAFHDGLGLGAVSLVVDERYAAHALRLTLAHSLRIERLVVVSREPQAGDTHGALQDPWSNTPHPVLVLSESNGPDAHARMAEFLRE